MDWSKFKDIEEAKRFISNPHYAKTGKLTPSKWIDDYDFNDKIVIDFGCGVGRNTKAILEKYEPKTLICYDYPNMIGFAREYLGKLLERARLIKYPIENLDTKPDYLIADVVFQHIKNDELHKILEYLQGLLKPFGRLLIYSRGFSDDGFNVWETISKYFIPITLVDLNDKSIRHQFAEFIAR